MHNLLPESLPPILTLQLCKSCCTLQSTAESLLSVLCQLDAPALVLHDLCRGIAKGKRHPPTGAAGPDGTLCVCIRQQPRARSCARWRLLELHALGHVAKNTAQTETCSRWRDSCGNGTDDTVTLATHLRVEVCAVLRRRRVISDSPVLPAVLYVNIFKRVSVHEWNGKQLTQKNSLLLRESAVF